MVAISRPLTNLIDMHDRQAIGRETVNHIPNAFDTARIGKIDGNTDIGKPSHRSRAHAADNDRFYLGCMEQLNGHHAAAGLMTAVGDGRYALDPLLIIKFNHRKNVTVAEMF